MPIDARLTVGEHERDELLAATSVVVPPNSRTPARTLPMP
jgi:hypothetical protein